MGQAHAGAKSVPGVKYSRLSSAAIHNLAKTSPHDATLLEELLQTVAGRRDQAAKDAKRYIESHLNFPRFAVTWRWLRGVWNWLLSEMWILLGAFITALVTGFATATDTLYVQKIWEFLWGIPRILGLG